MPGNAGVAIVNQSAHHLVPVEQAVPGVLKNLTRFCWVLHIENGELIRTDLDHGILTIHRHLNLPDSPLGNFESSQRYQFVLLGNLVDARPSGAFGDEGVSIGYRNALHIIADFVERREFPPWKESIAARIAIASAGEKSSVTRV